MAKLVRYARLADLISEQTWREKQGKRFSYRSGITAKKEKDVMRPLSLLQNSVQVKEEAFYRKVTHAAFTEINDSLSLYQVVLSVLLAR